MKRTVALLLFTIISISFLLRIYQLTEIPPGLNRDEAAIGYTAYSLLKTGRDEYGKLLPLSLKSFGDWKVPLYIYLTIPSVAVFGLNDFAVRLPSVMFGTLTVLLIFFITQRLFKNTSLSLVATALLAISPWHLFFSRVASEANLGVFLISFSFLLLLYADYKKWFLPFANVLLGLSLIAYHGNHLFTPLIFIGFVIFFHKQFKTKIGLISIAIFFIIAGVIFAQTLTSADKTKISGLFALNDVSLVHENIVLNRPIYSDAVLGRIFNNKLVFLVESVVTNYIRSFSPEFLVISGGGNAQHNIPDFGNLYLIEFIFLLLGLYFLFAKKEKASWLLIYWMAISAIGAALTKDAPHSARQFAILPSIQIIAAYGIIAFVKMWKRRDLHKIIGVIILGMFFLNATLFINRYFILFPYKAYKSWGKGYEEMVKKVMRYKNEFSEIYVGRPEYSPYIYYLFYQKSNPKIVQETIERYPETNEGFAHVKAFDGVQYRKLAWSEELLVPNKLYVDWVEAVPKGATASARLITKTEMARLQTLSIDTGELQIGDLITSRLIDQVNLPDGSPLFYFIATAIGTPAAVLK